KVLPTRQISTSRCSASLALQSPTYLLRELFDLLGFFHGRNRHDIAAGFLQLVAQLLGNGDELGCLRQRFLVLILRNRIVSRFAVWQPDISITSIAGRDERWAAIRRESLVLLSRKEISAGKDAEGEETTCHPHTVVIISHKTMQFAMSGKGAA